MKDFFDASLAAYLPEILAKYPKSSEQFDDFLKEFDSLPRGRTLLMFEEGLKLIQSDKYEKIFGTILGGYFGQMMERLLRLDFHFFDGEDPHHVLDVAEKYARILEENGSDELYMKLHGGIVAQADSSFAQLLISARIPHDQIVAVMFGEEEEKLPN